MAEVDLRDYFASNSPFSLGDSIELLKMRLREQQGEEEKEEPKVGIDQAIQYLARLNYVYADNMVAVRQASQQKPKEQPTEESGEE